MRSHAKTPLCSDNDSKCQVCQLSESLIREGAKTIPWTNLYEQSCKLRILSKEGHKCIRGLRLDMPGAKYRHLPESTRRMCDFSILAVFENTAQLIVIELKSGYASSKDIDQLTQGLQVLYEYFEDNGLTARPQAYLVANKGLNKFKFSLRDKLTSLRFGSKPVKLEILQCGDALHL